MNYAANKAKIIARVYERRAWFASLGLCIYCGDRPPTTSRRAGKPAKGCTECLDYFRAYARAKRAVAA